MQDSQGANTNTILIVIVIIIILVGGFFWYSKSNKVAAPAPQDGPSIIDINLSGGATSTN